jgi:hypothetical protein
VSMSDTVEVSPVCERVKPDRAPEVDDVEVSGGCVNVVSPILS